MQFNLFNKFKLDITKNEEEVKGKITVAYAPDDRFADIALVSMMSLLEHTRRKVEIIIMYSKLSEKSFWKFNSLKRYKNCKLSYICVNEDYFEEFPIAHWLTVQAWFRTKIPDWRPDLDKVIYLDCDTFFMDDIAKLWRKDISNVLAAVVRDVYGSAAQTQKLGLKSGCYFNSGVMYINCKKWRENNLFEVIKAYVLEHPELLGASDQDALNKILDEDKRMLPQKFNYLEVWWQNCYHEYEGKEIVTYEWAKRKPVIVHFTAWKPSEFRSYHSFKDAWWQVAKRSVSYVELLENYKKSADAYFIEKGRS